MEPMLSAVARATYGVESDMSVTMRALVAVAPAKYISAFELIPENVTEL